MAPWIERRSKGVFLLRDRVVEAPDTTRVIGKNSRTTMMKMLMTERTIIRVGIEIDLEATGAVMVLSMKVVALVATKEAHRMKDPLPISKYSSNR
jgi:hypothetical protein